MDEKREQLLRSMDEILTTIRSIHRHSVDLNHFIDQLETFYYLQELGEKGQKPVRPARFPELTKKEGK